MNDYSISEVLCVDVLKKWNTKDLLYEKSTLPKKKKTFLKNEKLLFYMLQPMGMTIDSHLPVVI